MLNGEKCYISGTAEATEIDGGYFVSGYTDRSKGHKGMTALFMPINAPGVEITKRFENMGRMAISTGGFKMTDVQLPKEYQLGEEGKGFYYTMEGFDAARVLVSASCIGAAERAMELGMDYIKQRQVFGQPIAKFQGVQFDLADMAAHHEAIKSLVYRTAWMLDQKYKTGKFDALRGQQVPRYVQVSRTPPRPRCLPKSPPLDGCLRLHEGVPSRDGSPWHNELLHRRRGRSKRPESNHQPRGPWPPMASLRPFFTFLFILSI